jgi:hypothetical protein
MHLVAAIFGISGQLGLASAWLGAAITLGALYPLCHVYRAYKSRHPKSVLRFI